MAVQRELCGSRQQNPAYQPAHSFLVSRFSCHAGMPRGFTEVAPHMSDTRDLSDHERSVLEFLLQGDWDGAAVLREQLTTAMHAGSSKDSAAFEVAVDASSPRAPKAVPVPSLGDVFLRVEDGVLVGLGCSAAVKELPPLEKLLAA